MLDTSQNIRRQTTGALVTGLVFGVGFFAWTALMPLDGAVTASGLVALENSVKKVQHQTGGIVGQIFVREGARVKEGALLVKLDDTTTRANLGIILNDLVAGKARLARLVSERDQLAKVVFPDELTKRAVLSTEVRSALENELKLFENRVKSRDGQRQQLKERIGQLRQELGGLATQRQSIDEQLRVAREELADLKGLQAKGLVQRPRITALDREVARNEGVLGDVIARTAASMGKIAEVELQIVQIDRDMVTEVSKDFRETETKISELNEKRVAADDQLRRVEITAPISGIVQQLQIHTVGGVVSPSDPLMLIVPDGDQLIVEVRLQPQDRDQIKFEQDTRVRFSSFNQRTTPELNATVFRISGDVVRDAQSGAYYYTVGVRVPDRELVKLNGAKLVPGMPADAFFKTDTRTLLSYLLKPLTDHWQTTFTGR
ncbi:MAG: HlyD family type I secretion periplasmic adaptor subunit [Hyphomicrobiaceae bacterium]|nr:HlyD family type I secretion periplasmic adaptor subunit [Hyphomicrobiaceae bacterium]